jgi:hypothetical protein
MGGYPCMAWNFFYKPTKNQSTLILFNQAPQNVEMKIDKSFQMPVDNVKYFKFWRKILTFLLYRLIICDFNFISSNNGTDNVSKISFFSFLTKHHKMSKWKLSFPDQSSIAKWLIKEKKDIFETLSVPLLDDIKLKSQIIKQKSQNFEFTIPQKIKLKICHNAKCSFKLLSVAGLGDFIIVRL